MGFGEYEYGHEHENEHERSRRPALDLEIHQVSAMLAKACALVLEDYPVVNARYEPGQTVYQKDINIAMAVAIDGGLITPTLKVTVAMTVTV